MYYKVMKNNRVIDVLDKLIYVKWQEKHKLMVLCDENEAQGILSSDGEHVWHESSLYEIPINGYDTVLLEEIDKYEYERLKALNYKTAEEIFDEAVIMMLERSV